MRIILMSPHVRYTKFPTSVMVIGVLNSEGHDMPPDFFQQDFWLNAVSYTLVMETVVKPWKWWKTVCVSAGLCTCLQSCGDSKLDGGESTQQYQTKHVATYLIRPKSLWGVVERETRQHSHNWIPENRHRSCDVCIVNDSGPTIIKGEGGYIE